MKRIVCIILAMLLLLFVIPTNTMAAQQGHKENIIYLEDGSYLEITISEGVSRAAGTKSGSKTVVYRDSNSAEQWRVVLSGTFTYTGTSATCTASSINATITDTAWYVVSKSASQSGATASGELTMGRKFLGITVDKEPVGLTLTCDKDGNLS